ncbi:zf-TFIIB domain-containing protein, partial [Enterococcus sp. S141_ASV_20]|nr:zf-TFIIB domain-containing protein [Enterococcus sp. S141_ASV_20]
SEAGARRAADIHRLEDLRRRPARAYEVPTSLVARRHLRDPRFGHRLFPLAHPQSRPHPERRILMPLLLCPNDNGSMQTVQRSGIEFDICPT